jgi:hypothetical protein
MIIREGCLQPSLDGLRSETAMFLRRAFMTVMLASGLLLLCGTVTAESIERYTDQHGTMHIRNPRQSNQKKAGEVKAEGKAGQDKAPSGPAASNQEPSPGLIPSTSRRPYGPEAEARRKAILERRQSPPPPSAASIPKVPPGKLQHPPPAEPPQKKEGSQGEF